MIGKICRIINSKDYSSRGKYVFFKYFVYKSFVDEKTANISVLFIPFENCRGKINYYFRRNYHQPLVMVYCYAVSSDDKAYELGLKGTQVHLPSRF